MSDSVISTPHTVVRWSIDTGATFPDFRARFEAAVPELAMRRLTRLRERSADWAEVTQAAEENAPHGFMRFWSTDVGATMRLAGDRGDCASYLMGNHTIAERMYRHDRAVMLCAPLRAAIHTDEHGATRFSIDQPSTRFDAFANPEIAKVGVELDRKVIDLLRFLDVPADGLLLKADAR